MSEPIKCFMLEPTDIAFRWLRRYETGDCPEQSSSKPEYRYHCNLVHIEDGVVKTEKQKSPGGDTPGIIGGERMVYKTEPAEWPKDDPRWPAVCKCGYAFSDKAAWQLFWNVAYRDPSGKLLSIHSSHLPGVEQASVGAMWDAEWWPDKADDGKCLTVRCPRNPDGTGVSDWMIDGPSLSGGKWTRTGTPPIITASPSIFISPPDGWHGWLRDGFLVKC